MSPRKAAVALVGIALAAGVAYTLGGRPPRPVPAESRAAAAPEPAFSATVPNPDPAPSPAPAGMKWVPGGEFSMGSVDPVGLEHGGHDSMPDTRPIHRVYVDAFWMDETELTNAQFAKFVAATRYVTVAERTPRAEDYPTAPKENLVAGSVVFTPPDHEVPLDNHYQWWRYLPGMRFEVSPFRGAWSGGGPPDRGTGLQHGPLRR